MSLAAVALSSVLPRRPSEDRDGKHFAKLHTKTMPSFLPYESMGFEGLARDDMSTKALGALRACAGSEP